MACLWGSHSPLSFNDVYLLTYLPMTLKSTWLGRGVGTRVLLDIQSTLHAQDLNYRLFVEVVPSSHLFMSLWVQTQVSRLCSPDFYPLSHLANTIIAFF